MNALSERITLIAKNTGMTNTAFAEKLNITQASVSRLLSGKQNPSDRTLIDICDKFGVNETWLRTGEGPMYKEVSEEEALSEFFGRMLKEDVPYRNEIILCLSRMSPEGWKAVGDKILEIADEIRKKGNEEEK